MREVPPAADRLVRLSTFVGMLQRSRASIYRDIRRGTLPKPPKQGASARWRQSEILAYIEDRSQARSDGDE